MTALARAQVAADLARVYLIDNRAADALRALDSTRIAGLPTDLVDERRVLQARALAALGRTEHALELVAYDQGPEADRLRADIAWDGRNWSEAGRLMETLLGDRWRSVRLRGDRDWRSQNLDGAAFFLGPCRRSNADVGGVL